MLKAFSGGYKFVTGYIVRFFIFPTLVVFIEDPYCSKEFREELIAVMIAPLLITAESRGPLSRMRIFAEICHSLGEEEIK